MKSLLRKVSSSIIKPFLPKYEVVCTSYQVIPGHPVNGNQQKHTFEKGASAEARKFYVKVINSDMTRTMAPVEVHLKRRGRTIEKRNFGPVEELKKFNIVYKG
ncbi:hypothetical protein [Pontibacter flavimaris]|jgi:hypothetical protein|uniref:Uncharacterized protein n=1 Tax=Pontibacter flavimaris TaxID=1797110 RepID=A0A1Q5PFH1_9BACT|nr:hypothetical protein [Pontibacter flavimaris]OKL41000.1 hypothetical protein A3841_14295 [Pontibacter flavimaris]